MIREQSGSTPGATFARRLREQRRSAQMTQTELAKRLSDLLGTTVDASAITKIEKGERGVRLDEAAYAAQILGVPLGALVSEADAAQLRLQELRLELGRQESRQKAASWEANQASQAMIDIEQQIERLEVSRGDR